MTPPGDRAGSDDARLARLAALIAGSPHNLVARSQHDELRTTHIAEASALLPHLALAPRSRWLDLGTGGGLPGLVLAVHRADVSLTLVDSVGKKVAEVARFAAELGLGNVVAVHARAEALARDPAHRGAYDGVVSRAVAPLPALLELSRGFVAPGGVIAAVKGPAHEDEAAAAAGLLDRMALAPLGAVRVTAQRPTWLVRYRALGPAPSWVPRATGVPQRTPLAQ